MKIALYAMTQGLSFNSATGGGPHLRGLRQGLEQLGHEVVPLVATDVLAHSRGNHVRSRHLGPHGIRSAAKRLPTPLVNDIRALVFYHQVRPFMAQQLRQVRPDAIYERSAYLDGSVRQMANCHSIPHALEVDVQIVRLNRLEFGSWLWPLADRIERRKLQRLAPLIVSSDYARGVLLTEHRLAPGKVWVKHMGVDVDAFDPRRYSRDAERSRLDIGDRVAIGFLGAFRRYHALEILIEAAACLHDVGRAAVILLAGSDGHYEALRAQVGERGLSNVRLIPLIPHERVPPFLAALDVAVVPGGTQSALYPIKLLEYGAMAKAVLVPDWAPFHEVVEDGVSGLMFRPGSTTDFADRLSALIQDEGLRQRLGRALRETILQSFTWAKVGERIMAAYGTSGLTQRGRVV